MENDTASDGCKETKRQGRQHYLEENRRSLVAEFPQADPEWVLRLWNECNKDCDLTRSRMRQHLGLLPEGGGEKEVALSTYSTLFSLTETVGDLFENCGSEDACMAHCVSRCLAMSKGIAVPFKKKFGRVAELKAQNANIGECAILLIAAAASSASSRSKKINNVNEAERKSSVAAASSTTCTANAGKYIYYMVTKERYLHKPTYQSVQASLVYMRDHMVANGMTKLCMPRIGCGLDGLEWSNKSHGGIKQLILDVFQDTNISITVYRLE